MAVFNTFTFDGENSLDYGVYITGEAVYNAPERAIEMVSIPGKNGALALDQGRFENIEVTYPAGMFGVKQAAFAGRMRAMRNMLASRYNYVRLTDSYHPDEYRLGLYKSGLEATPVAMSSAGEFDITFNCKPQRFLTSGEEPVDTSEVSGEVTTNRDPYLFRRSGGGSIGHDFGAEIDKIIGGTVAWNQLIDGVTDYSNPATDTATKLSLILNLKPSYEELFRKDISSPQVISTIVKTSYDSTNGFVLRHNGRTRDLTIYSSPSTVNIVSKHCYFLYMNITSADPTTVGGVQIKNIMLIDLTALFGSAEIADYVYSLEQTTSGLGIAWLRNHGFLTKDYYAYNSGSLKSVKTSEHRTSGKNLLITDANSTTVNGITFTRNADGSVTANGTASAGASFYLYTGSYNSFAIPNGNYKLTGCPSGGAWNKYIIYADNRSADGSSTISTSADVGSGGNLIITQGKCRASIYIASGTTVNNLVFEPMIRFADADATYEPYESHSYPLDSDLELRGIPKLDSSNNLYYDGDVYESSGNVTRKYVEIDLGSLTYWFNNESGHYYFASYEVLDGVKIPSSNNVVPNATSPAYTAATMVDAYNNVSDIIFGINSSGKLLLVDSYAASQSMTGAQFKTYVTGKKLVYELATPTTETADPYANPQVVNPLGTEEYVDTRDVPVPVGHETKYGMSQLVLTNPTEFPSKPLLEVTGVGTFWLGDTLFTITGTTGQTIYIDCETGEAWKNVGGVITPANGLVTLNRLDFPELDPGDTPVMYGTGITKVVVTPRWWII